MLAVAVVVVAVAAAVVHEEGGGSGCLLLPSKRGFAHALSSPIPLGKAKLTREQAVEYHSTSTSKISKCAKTAHANFAYLKIQKVPFFTKTAITTP